MHKEEHLGSPRAAMTTRTAYVEDDGPEVRASLDSLSSHPSYKRYLHASSSSRDSARQDRNMGLDGRTLTDGPSHHRTQRWALHTTTSVSTLGLIASKQLELTNYSGG